MAFPSAIGISPEVGVLDMLVSFDGEEPVSADESPLRRRAWVAGESGAVKCDLRLFVTIMLTAHSSRLTGVRLAA